MSIMTIRLSNELLSETKKSSKMLRLTHTAYVRSAIMKMNQAVLADKKKRQLQSASLKVRNESMKVNKEFDAIDYDIKD